MKRIDVAIAIVLREGKVLITRRKEGGVLGGLWEFPGGKCEGGETVHQCLQRELWEELELQVRPTVTLGTINHSYAQFEVCLHPFICLIDAGKPKLIAAAEARWVEPVQLREYEFPPANAVLIEEVIRALTAPFAAT
jgi:8-oxo-dGTP diphosphatase